MQSILNKMLGLHDDEEVGEPGSEENPLDGMSGRQRRKGRRRAVRMLQSVQARHNRDHQRQLKAKRRADLAILQQARILSGLIGTDAQRERLLPIWTKNAAEAGLTLDEGIAVAFEAYGHLLKPRVPQPLVVRRMPKGRTRFEFRRTQRAFKNEVEASVRDQYFSGELPTPHKLVRST